MRAAWLVVSLIGVGCGRFGFDTARDGFDARPSADAKPDSAPTLPAWQLVQVTGSASNSGVPSLMDTQAATGAGHLLVVGLQFEPGLGFGVTGVTDNAPAGTSDFVAVPASLATNTPAGDGLEIWYASSAHAGATTVTASASPLAYAMVVWEFATEQPATVDAANALSTQPAATTLMSPVVATERVGELVIAIAITSNDVLGIEAGNEFTNDSMENGNGWAHLTSGVAAAGNHQAEWDAQSGTYCSDAVAFHVGE